MDPQRVSLITLGVADIARSQRFYETLGWRPVASKAEGVVFFRLKGSALALFGLADLAVDQDRPAAGLGTGAITLAQNFPSQTDVDDAYALALSAGACEVKQPAGVFCGGHYGYYADPDGHVWELAFNPFWSLDEEGSLTIPETDDD